MTDTRITVDETILQWALRYALGRQTCVPGDVQQAVRENLHQLTPRFLDVAIRDIDEAERLTTATVGGINALGSPTIDAPGWLRLRDDMRAAL